MSAHHSRRRRRIRLSPSLAHLFDWRTAEERGLAVARYNRGWAEWQAKHQAWKKRELLENLRRAVG